MRHWGGLALLKRLLLLLAIGIVPINLPPFEPPVTPVAPDDWQLVWSDEFNGAAGDPPNPLYWSCVVGDGGWGNREWEYYTDRAENVATDGNGHLVITARAETLADTDCWYGTCTYTSARCTTRGKIKFTYGRIEARLRLPQGQGIWPAFWMLGANYSQVGWPDSGEIDIMEHIGSEPHTVYGTLHGPGYFGEDSLGNIYNLVEPVYEDYHVFGIEWEANIIRWYVDDEWVGSFQPGNLNGNPWVFNRAFFILINLAVGGTWPGYPDATTIFPQTLQVDWVRIYQRPGHSAIIRPEATPTEIPFEIPAPK